ncbi:DUF4192 domain-containing protein [Mycolicibacterium thermoresistibile]|jgi:hypothetical protein|uniref:DUF4192 domain-containing protein n=2 Tax=Mycolicibacterium thermoresistibile TaxID=1797 RepID=G7CIB5_MYCT3|nr:DUF4192 domain-containing protein [Mycolicibacterium thermoresistibile]EHI12522.1 hypothetical protein KEK_16523 [Mycolicibacterium thermoresistibile ATCC 19527]MCV7190211.1 DUF4192 domain-containing protein [Mycolicibacterium thermoresistibile]GAT13728.1 hypothetical protein RMCT_0699 [Mycolicibacterium thermoresistibile]SNW18901.1 Uncharacterised protein [Mycolicibacterium thermoresistibile]
MPTSRTPDFNLNRPGELIAALPAVLGFVPEHSLVLVTVDDGELGCVLRIDLSDAPSIERLAEVAAAAAPAAAIAVIVDRAGAACGVCNDRYRQLAAELTDELARHGIELLAAHVVDRVAAGGRWHCADGCGAGGRVEDPSASPLAAAAVLDGRRLYTRRSELVAVVEPAPDRDPDLAEAITRTAERRGELRTDAQARRDVQDMIAAAGRIAAGSDIGEPQLCALACALTDGRVRDTLYALAVGDDAAIAENLWAWLARMLPEPWRTEALVLLAFSAYARGDGPLAGVSLDAALRGDPNHRMAGMLDTALQSGLRPERIRELALTGYRMADRLGVRLPPRRAFGRAG